MKAYLDGLPVDIDPKDLGVVSLSLRRLTDLREESDVRTVDLRDTPRNRRALGAAVEPNTAEDFNAAQHILRIEASSGATLVEGNAFVQRVVQDERKGRTIRLKIAPRYSSWLISAMRRKFSDTAIPFSKKMSQATIITSWSGAQPVRFLPVVRGRLISNAGIGTWPNAVVSLSYRDYHPFIHLATAIGAIVGAAGYTIESKFMDTPFFDSLHMSGNYPAQNVEGIKSSMDFLAGRFTAATAKGDFTSKVWMSSLYGTNSVGNIVDTADPLQTVSGVRIPWVFSNNGCFTATNNIPIFKPLYEITAAAFFELRYITDYYIVSRSRLKGYDTVALDDGVEQVLPIANPFIDRRAAISQSVAMLAIVFDHAAGNSYQFRYTNSSGVQVIASTFAARTAIVSSPASPVTNPELWCKASSASTYTLYTGDWALYDGHVTERGQIGVELNITSQPRKVTPGSPMRFDRLYIRGAEASANFTLLTTTRVSPVFDCTPGFDSPLSFGDVAAHSFRQLELLQAVQHLFNLAFYTDGTTRTLYIEPMAAMVDRRDPLDWSDKIEPDLEIIVEQAGTDEARTIVYGYKSGDSNVERFNAQNDDDFSSWHAVNINAPAAESLTERTNNIFMPLIDRTGSYPYSPDASMPCLGNPDTEVQWNKSLNFAPRIVSYRGLTPLPQGQSWGFPSFGKEYPLSGFCLPSQGVNLCFEDRGVVGLHRFHDDAVRALNLSQRVVVWLNLTTEDVEHLLHPDPDGNDIRRAVRLRIDGEDTLYSIEYIADLNTEKEEPVKVTLIKIVGGF